VQPARRCELRLTVLPKITILIASRNRAPLLERLLRALAAQQDAPVWEAVVVDNGSSDETPHVLARLARQLPIVPLHEPRPSKSRAMNCGLAAVRGEFVLFTDDDVRPSSRWCADLYSAWRAHRHADVFCGPIIPEFPGGAPPWLRTLPFRAAAFSEFRPNLPAGPLPAPWVPLGPNFAVSRQALSGMSFRVDLGPSEEQGPLMSEDVEFVEELGRRSKQFFFVPTASVIHCIRPDLATVPVLLERAFALGRSDMIRGKRYDLRADLFSRAQSQAGFLLNCIVSFMCGLLLECHARGHRERSRELIQWIAASSWRAEAGSIARSAEIWLRNTPEIHASLANSGVSANQSILNSRA
jgi:GT2 family glycosyltransferase